MGYGMAPPSLFRRIGVLGLGAVFLLDSKAKQWWAAWKDWTRKRRCGMDCDVAFPKRLSITFNYLSCQEWTSCNLICTCIFRPVRQHNHELQFYVFISFASFTMEKLKRRADSSPSILRTGLNKKVDEGDFQAVLKKACARAVVWICLWDPMRKADLQRTQTGTKSDQNTCRSWLTGASTSIYRTPCCRKAWGRTEIQRSKAQGSEKWTIWESVTNGLWNHAGNSWKLKKSQK